MSDRRYENWISKRNMPEIASSDMSNLPKSHDELLLTNMTSRQSRISANFVKLDGTPININHTCGFGDAICFDLYARKYCAVYFLFPAPRENLYVSQCPTVLHAVTYTHILALNETTHCIAYISTGGNKDKICASEAGISSERVGLAGWYCRAGCGKSSHFGDEISLSNPAPCFIRSGHPRYVPRWQTFLYFV